MGASWGEQIVNEVTKLYLRGVAHDPTTFICPHLDCPSRGIVGAGNLRVHDSLRNRWRCKVCKKTFSGRQGTPCYALKTDEARVTLVLTLLAFGCPVQAIVAAFELDERTVADWQQRAGKHCETVHCALVEQPHDLGQVQADEIRVRCQKRLVLWMALAICATPRLWLGGGVSDKRDRHLGRAIAQAAGLTGRIWSVGELLCYQVAPPPFMAPKRQGRKPRNAGALSQKGAADVVTV